jgi:hypothetical protein
VEILQDKIETRRKIRRELRKLGYINMLEKQIEACMKGLLSTSLT